MTRAPRLSPLLLAAALLAGCGGDDEPPGQRSVDEVVAAEPGAIEESVTLEGRAYPIADIGFALAGDEAAVLVPLLPTEIAKLSDGEQVQGEVDTIGAGRALRLGQEMEQPGGLGLPRNDDALAELELDQGAPAIADASVTAEDGPLRERDGG
jgi:hypothetical protein